MGDWTTQGAVTAVKDQGQCGSCWAFSTTGGIEGAWEIASGRLQALSEQQLVDCDTKTSADCQGGDMATAFAWAETHDMATEDSYPYSARDKSCKTSGFNVAIEADQMSFQMYSGGVLSSGCGTELDHGVLAVGYGSGFFKVKNSWGQSWGMSGYLKISDSGNTCGIHSDAVYPTVSASVSV